jgi:hypothetical protein
MLYRDLKKKNIPYIRSLFYSKPLSTITALCVPSLFHTYRQQAFGKSDHNQNMGSENKE